MKDMDIIFGPLHQQHIKPLADFADKHDIRLVIPFTSKDNTVFRNPSVYQINTPQSYLYSEVYDHFVRQFPNANVIFIEASQDTKDKAEFIKGLKEELRNRSIPTKSLKEDATVESMKAVLRNDRENIFIPTSGSNITLIKILPQLTLLVREQPDSRVHLFGYPEWQTYTKDHLEAFFELDTYFYSSFYTNNLLPAAITFTKSYRNGMEKRWTSVIRNSACWGSIPAISSSKAYPDMVRDLKKTWIKWTLSLFRPASSSNVSTTGAASSTGKYSLYVSPKTLS